MSNFDETVDQAVNEAYQNGLNVGKQALREVLEILSASKSPEELEEFIQESLRALEEQ